MLKKILSSMAKALPAFAISLLPLTADAAPRTAAEAQQLAEQYLQLNSSKASLSLAEPSTRAGEQNYFSFNVSDDQGFVIVSADDNFQEILGYSDKGNFADAQKNPSFLFWLSNISSEMASASSAKTRSAAPAKAVPMKAVMATDVAPLLRSKWNQNEPYNNDCYVPRTNDHAPTGCVATAMAQVLYYYQWPQYYVNGDERFEYKWDLMLPEYAWDADPADESVIQVARLMKDCGVSVNMSYGYNASSAYSTDVPPAMVNNFSYDAKTMKLLYRNSFGYEAIHKILYTEFKEGRPVIASGSYPESNLGHEFVLDGCTTEGLIHVNWGWSGYCDGYYRLTSMRPEDFGTGGSEEGYSFYMDLLIGIQPDKNLDPTALTGQLTGMGDIKYAYGNEETIDYYFRSYITSNGYYFIPVSTENGRYDGFGNTGAGTIVNARFATRLVNQATGEETICVDPYGNGAVLELPCGYFYSTAPMVITDAAKEFEPAEGVTYKAYLGYVYDDDPTFHEAQFGPSQRSCLILERKGDYITVTHTPTTIDLIGEFPAGLDRIARKTPVNFSVSFKNNSDIEYLGEIKWRFLDKENDFYYGNVSDFLMLDLLPGESITEDFTLYKLKNLYPGQYRIGLYDFRDRLISDLLEIEVYDYTLAIDETNFPDPTFREYIINNFDRDRNGVLDDDELTDVHYIQMYDLPVESLKGIENFTNLWMLTVTGASLTELNLSDLPELYYIYLSDLPLSSLTFNNVPDLINVTVTGTGIRELDLSAFSQLNSIDISYNTQLESLLLPNQALLSDITCRYNSLSSIDLTPYYNLTYFNCEGNFIKELDLSNNTTLQLLTITRNHIESIDISNLKELTAFYAEENNLKGVLDVSELEKLAALSVEENALTGLELGYHPEMSMITAYSNEIEGTVDFTGCENITWIMLSHNKIKNVKFGNHPALGGIDLASNEIEGTLDLSGTPALTSLYANFNKISEFKYVYYPEMYNFWIQGNALSHVNLDEFLPQTAYYFCNDQVVPARITTKDLDLAPFLATGFDLSRASNWVAYWNDRSSWVACDVTNTTVEIPEEAGDEIDLVYQYLADPFNDYSPYFTIKLTRDINGSVDGLLADGSFTVSGNSVRFGDGVNGEVYSAEGILIYSGSGSTEALPCGVYIVRIGSRTAKIKL